MASTWIHTLEEKQKRYPALNADISVDVAVIGAGITGVSAAYLLSKAGKKVALLTSTTSAESATAYTTGFLMQGVDTPMHYVVKMFGEEKAQALWRLTGNAIDLVEETIRQEQIDCEFVRCPSYLYATSRSERMAIEKEGEVIRKLGFEAALRRSGNFPFANEGYLEIPRQAKFHALKYVLALKEAAMRSGAEIYDNTEAINIERVGEKRAVRTKNGTVLAKDVFIATYYPFTRPRQTFAHTAAYLTYIFEMSIPTGALPEGLYEDMKNPYHYFRVDRAEHNDRLIVGGEDHRKELPINPERNYRALEKYASLLLPGIETRIREKWRGSIIEPLDGLPYIGPLKSDPHQYVATGFSGTGMTYSRIAAQIVSDAILGRKNASADLYTLSRLPTPYQIMRKSLDYVGEFFGGAVKNVFA